MAKKATRKSGETKAKTAAKTGAKMTSKGGKSLAVKRAPPSRSRGSGNRHELDGMGDAVVKLLQSPIVADLIAVAATAALAALAEHGFSSRDSGGGAKRAGNAAKEAGKAAVAAVGRRLGNEMDEICKAAKDAIAKA